MDIILNLSVIEQITEKVLNKTIKEIELAYAEPIGGNERTKLEHLGKIGFFNHKFKYNIEKELSKDKVKNELNFKEEGQEVEVHFDKEMNLLNFGSSKYDLTIVLFLSKEENIRICLNGLMEEYLTDQLPEIKCLIYETEGFPIRPATFEKYITDQEYRQALQVQDEQPTTEEVEIIKLVEDYFNIRLRRDLTFKDLGNSLQLAEQSSLYKSYMLPVIEILSVFIKDNRQNNGRNIKVKISVSEEVLMGKERESFLNLLEKMNKTEIINGRLSVMY